MKTFRKQPRDHLDYDVVLSNWLYEDDEISSVDVNPPDGIEISSVGVMPDRIKLWVKGGTAGESYKISPLIHTKSRSKEVDILFVVVDE